MPLTREQDRLRMRRRRAALTVDEQEEERRKARERMRRLSRENPDRERGRKRVRRSRAKTGGMSPSEKGRFGAQSRWAGHQPVAFVRDRVPSEVRSAYGRAHPNSAIMRLYPTWDALRKNWPIHQPPKGT